MNYPTCSEEINILLQTSPDGDVETKDINDRTAAYDSSILDYDVKLIPARGIIFSLLLSVPFWILFITTVIFFGQK